MNPDILINQEAKLQPITDIASILGIDNLVEPYGKYKAKIDYTKVTNSRDAKLILVTAINPTPSGEGKTTTTIGLSDALVLLGKKSIVCLREPAMGPVFGRKGGATGGGYSQVAPMEDINLHFTGDFAAIASAHNLLAAVVHNHIYQGNALGITEVTWRRVIDMNDRELREQFDIVVASEVMAILCLVKDIEELKERLGDITVGYSNDKRITAKDLNANGAMTVLLKDAIKPNLVQTLEGNPAFIHGGPFANIAHGCNSIIATNLAMQLGDYVVTEAGFGSDLGMEKFIDIKCKAAGIEPDAVVLVATIRALKHHGNGDLALGFSNLKSHINNVTNVFNLPCVVCINKFFDDTDDDLNLVIEKCNELGTKAIISTHWKHGSKGAINLAEEVILAVESKTEKMKFGYSDELVWWKKVQTLAKNIYGIESLAIPLEAQVKLRDISIEFPSWPVCIAKTPVSLTADSRNLGNKKQSVGWVSDVEIRTGAKFFVVKLGNILTLPGLPEIPSAERIDYIDGKIIGLS